MKTFTARSLIVSSLSHSSALSASFGLFILLLTFPGWLYAESCQVADRAIEIASKTRGLKILAPVPCRVQSKEQVEKYLRETIDRKIPAEKLKSDERIGKLVGLFPPDYNYLDGIVTLYREQIGGFYEPSENYYAMAAWMPDIVQTQIAIHELTHALQDQHFNLDTFVDDKTMSTDEQLARSALIEGDATAVMMDYSRSTLGEGPLAKEPGVSAFMLQSILGSTLSPSLQAAPPAIQATIIFPYISGLNYVHGLLRDGGYRAVDKAFLAPPRTTREILHPGRTAPTTDRLQKDPAAVAGDSLGEFVVSTLLATSLPPKRAAGAADGLIDDRFDLYQDGSAQWTLRFESSEDKTEFVNAITESYNKRFSSRVWRDGFCSITIGARRNEGPAEDTGEDPKKGEPRFELTLLFKPHS